MTLDELSRQMAEGFSDINGRLDQIEREMKAGFERLDIKIGRIENIVEKIAKAASDGLPV